MRPGIVALGMVCVALAPALGRAQPAPASGAEPEPANEPEPLTTPAEAGSPEPASAPATEPEPATEPAPAPTPASEPAPASTSEPAPDAAGKPITLTRAPAGPPPWGVDGPYVLELHARLGAGLRLDEPPLYRADRVGGLLLGVGLGLELSQHVALGLAYEHLELGSESSGVLPTGAVDVTRGLHSGWLDLKLYPVRVERIGLYLAIAAGLSVQEADLTASLWRAHDPGASVEVFCGASDVGFALKGAVGFDAIIGPGVRVMLESGLANHRLSDELLDGCSPGAGTATVLAAIGGLGYAWDL